MVSAGNTDSSVTLTFRVREQVTPAMNRVESSLNRVGQAAASTGRFLGQNALQMVTVGSAMVAAASGAANLAVQFGLLNEEQAQTTTKFIQGAGAVVAIVGGLSQLGVFLATAGIGSGILSLGAALGTAAGQAALMTGAVAGLVVSLSALLAFSDVIPNALDRFLGATGLEVPRAPESIRRVANAPLVGPNAPNFAATGGGVTQIAVNVGTLVADEIGLREFTKRVGRQLQEESRIGGFQIP